MVCMGGMREAPQVDGSLVGRMSERQLARFHPREQAPSQRTGGEHLLQPVLSIVFQASMELCLSIRRLA